MSILLCEVDLVMFLMILSLRTPSEKYTKETCVDLMILFYPTLYTIKCSMVYVSWLKVHMYHRMKVLNSHLRQKNNALSFIRIPTVGQDFLVFIDISILNR